MRHVVIFGAASGFGKRLSLELRDLGHKVYGIDRSKEGLATLPRDVATFVADVTDETSVQAAIDGVMKLTDRIDVVVNNVGYGMYGPVERELSEILHQFDVNLFGYARVNNAVLPILRQQKSGTIIFTASVVSHISTTGLGWYAATKHAVKAMAEALRMEVMDLGIHVVQIEPGAVKTNFHGTANTTYPATIPPDYTDVMSRFETFQNKMYANAPSDHSTIKAFVHACTSTHPKWVYRTTFQAKAFAFLRPRIPLKWYTALVKMVEK
jgi:short-subunit dehydrogenase